MHITIPKAVINATEVILELENSDPELYKKSVETVLLSLFNEAQRLERAYNS